MTRIERARLIRDKLLFDYAADWELIQLGERTVAQLERGGVNAVLWNHSDLTPSSEAPLSLTLLKTSCTRPNPHSMDVWISGRRVLSLTWGETDQIRLELMERGAWEADYFGLSAPMGRRRPTLH